MQLMLEYLLNFQENQFKIIQENNHRLSKKKQLCNKLKRENVALQEDIKIYQRQLNLLKNAMNKVSNNLSNTDSVAERNAPRVVMMPWQGNEDPRNQNIDEEIIGSIINHEKETRAIMSSILDEQREMFLKQMSVLSETLRNMERNSRPRNSEDGAWEKERKMADFVSTTILQATNKLQEELKTALQAMVVARSSPSLEFSTASMEIKKKELQIFERELQMREHVLNEREQQFKKQKVEAIPSFRSPPIKPIDEIQTSSIAALLFHSACRSGNPLFHVTISP